jgi:hypothetical protein
MSYPQEDDMDAKMIVKWLKEKLGDDLSPSFNPLWKEHGYAFGDTESGFSSGYTIDYAKLEKEMDNWINETFQTELKVNAAEIK